MRYGKEKACFLGAVIFMCCASGAFADDSFTLTGVTPSGNNMGGVYTSPYVATITNVGSGINVVCDDYFDEVNFGETWQVAVTNLATLSTTGSGDANLRFNASDSAYALNAHAQDLGYLTVSILEAQLLSIDSSTEQAADLSFAIWDVFDPGASNGLADATTIANEESAAASLAASYLTQAGTVAGALALDNIANVTIFTADPDSGGAVTTCTLSPSCGTPQEFVTVSMAEPSSPSLLGLDLLGVVGLVFFARRRLAGSLGSTRS
jgi:hypothetical protein